MKDEKAITLYYRVENQQHFHSLKLQKKFGASKDLGLHPHNLSDILKFSWRCSYIRMIFYSTKNSKVLRAIASSVIS
ncbi:hypothetical protein ACP6PL_28685 [Dapis sp. BLCC M126]|uniref:hypothetical protein n=1 Tax=Dapis sp. BLCC M126 TaxID=3400189 RepID=UPI003CE7F4BF